MPFTIDGEWVPSNKDHGSSRPIEVRTQKRKGRILTLVLHVSDLEIATLFKELKTQCHCGGSIKGDQIELQGDHLQKVKTLLKQR